MAAQEPIKGEAKTPSWQIEVFYDNDCPLCRKEIRFLRWLDRRGQVVFTDISASDFNATSVGKTFQELMAEIHARLPDGKWIVGLEVFQRLYAAVGLGFLMWPTYIPWTRPWFDNLYQWFAKNRLRFTGRCDASCAPQNKDGVNV